MKASLKKPELYVIAGPNGAGKTTFAKEFLPFFARCDEFVNADLIASGLSPFSPERAALKAGRLLLDKIDELSKKKSTFGFETTLAGLTYVNLLKELKEQGYQIHLFFLWLPDVKLALNRVKERVLRGGHHIPDSVVKRRFQKGIVNLFNVYRPLLDSCILFDNSQKSPQMIYIESRSSNHVCNAVLYEKITKMAEVP